MTTAYTAKLIHGARQLNLSSGRYTCEFSPPGTNVTALMADGTSANRYGGSQKVGQKANNRNVSLRLRVRGVTDQEVTQGINDLRNFLELAGDPVEPLYLEYRNNSDVSPRPLWGQDTTRLYEIVHLERLEVWDEFGVASTRADTTWVDALLNVKPFALGQPQRLASALGGLVLDNFGATDGRSRGLILHEGTTNLFDNPVFGNATYLTDYTVQTDIVTSQITDPAFVLPGTTNSVEVTQISTGGTGQSLIESITAANTNTHTLSCYAKKRDGSAVTDADVKLRYNAALTTVYTAVGNGWYRLTWSGAGIASGTNTGIIMQGVGTSVIVAGFQFEENAYATPLIWGDLLGCSWSGTAHAAASTSTVAAGRARVPLADVLNLAEGSMRVVVLPFVANSVLPDANYRLFNGDNGFLGYRDETNTRWTFGDNTNSINSSADTFVAGTPIVLHFAYELGSLKIYKNGAQIATSSTYTPPSTMTLLYIGSSTTATLQFPGTLMDFTTYPVALTAAEVLADYTNVVQVANDGQRVGAIPWLWTKDGDDVVDNHDDSGEDNWCAVAGVPGSAPAETLIDATPSNTGTYDDIFLSLLAADKFLAPGDGYCDSFGTGDANSSGGEYEGLSVNTSDVIFGNDAGALLQESLPNAGYWAGREAYIFARLQDAGANLTIAASIDGSTFTTDYLAVDVAATMRLFRTLPFTFRSKASYLGDYTPDGLLKHNAVLLAKRTASGAATVGVDWLRLMFRPVAQLRFGTVGNGGFHYQGRTGIKGIAGNINVIGDPIEFVPDQINHLVVIMGELGDNPVIARTLTFDVVRVTPRYALL